MSMENIDENLRDPPEKNLTENFTERNKEFLLLLMFSLRGLRYASAGKYVSYAVSLSQEMDGRLVPRHPSPV